MNGNNCIGCNVCECKYHVDSSNTCSLNHIQVVKHGQGKTMECTDCASFESRR